LKNIYRLLKTDGKMFICHTANREEINAIHRKIPDLMDHLIPEGKKMRKMLSVAGFDEVSIADNSEYYLVEAKRPFTC